MIDGEFPLKNGEPIVIGWGICNENGDEAYKSPYQPGDILWVRETFLPINNAYYYKSDNKHIELEQLGICFKWRPSIHMPRDAARIFLRVMKVRVERLRDISPDDALAEGFTGYGTKDGTLDAFFEFWDSLNAKRGYGWDTNPWVWVYTFDRNIEQPCTPS
jgi:hypothetical protein